LTNEQVVFTILIVGWLLLPLLSLSQSFVRSTEDIPLHNIHFCLAFGFAAGAANVGVWALLDAPTKFN
jgi:hypothetical protein